MTQPLFDNYVYAGDVGVIAICFVIGVLLMTSYVSRSRNFHIFLNILTSIIIAAGVNIVYHYLLSIATPKIYIIIYILRVVYQGLLLDVFFLFALYTTQVAGMEHKKAKIVALVSVNLLMLIITVDVILSLTGHGFRITESGKVVGRTNVYLVGYVIFVALLAVLMSKIRHLVYKRILYGFYGTMVISVTIRFGQIALGQSSLTTMTFIFPAIAMLYIIHSNPYNVFLGSVDTRAMEDMVRNMHDRKENFVFLSLLLTEYDEDGKELPGEIRALVRKYSVDFFHGCVLFQIGPAHMVLVVPKRRNPDYEKRIANILASFKEQYNKLQRPYKIVIGESIEEVSRKNGYISLIENVEASLPENSIHRVDENDIARYNRDEYILHELRDIHKKRDVDDPRVLAYCQPVFNITTGKFDTAEALMRLELPETGTLPPVQFIPLAEKGGLIHVLTEIILNKTCREIRRLLDEGYEITRISVNVSASELKENAFCNDISRIINSNSISGDKIALELTESSCEADFIIMKEKIDELRRQGIQFYLDDFGTGYSNMQRIMELPFDIIKFDRSMVIASGTDDRSEKIVENLAHMFRDMEYSILYEGVEDSSDEERCKIMSASYLQGFKYSRPVPIENLRDFLQRAA